MDKRNTPDFVNWLRNSSPYIRAHRGRTFVVLLPGQALLEDSLSSLAQDLTLLTHLGVRLVLVHDIDTRLQQRLGETGHQLTQCNGLPVTDDTALQLVREICGTARLDLEAVFSSGLTTSAVAGPGLRLVSGNLITARPVGMRDGIDHLHSGELRRVDAEAIRAQLDLGALVVLSPVGYSPTGELFYLDAGEVATGVAMALRADKLLLLTEEHSPVDAEGRGLEVLTPSEAEQTAASPSCPGELQRRLTDAVHACRGGVRRAHLINRHYDGALLQELYSRDGIGTLVTHDEYDAVRTATVDDIGGILRLITPLEAEGILVPRSREQLELLVDDFVVMERDGMVVACASLHEFTEARAGEIACVAVHPDYRSNNRGEVLLQMLELRARRRGLHQLFALTTRTTHWFREQGFEPARLEDLPVQRQAMYNYQRRSRVLNKSLER